MSEKLSDGPSLDDPMGCVRDFRPEDAQQVADIFEVAIRGLGPRDYSADQVRVWAACKPDKKRVIDRASDGRVTLVAVDRDDVPAVFPVSVHETD